MPCCGPELNLLCHSAGIHLHIFFFFLKRAHVFERQCYREGETKGKGGSEHSDHGKAGLNPNSSGSPLWVTRTQTPVPSWLPSQVHEREAESEVA